MHDAARIGSPSDRLVSLSHSTGPHASETQRLRGSEATVKGQKTNRCSVRVAEVLDVPRWRVQVDRGLRRAPRMRRVVAVRSHPLPDPPLRFQTSKAWEDPRLGSIHALHPFRPLRTLVVVRYDPVTLHPHRSQAAVAVHVVRRRAEMTPRRSDAARAVRPLRDTHLRIGRGFPRRDADTRAAAGVGGGGHSRGESDPCFCHRCRSHLPRPAQRKVNQFVARVADPEARYQATEERRRRPRN
ncbi:hypothetical protein Purlil1_11123 [Purpureocillium lilacinum]|uniref:Uncharacterized protein n=1 Tax=Purpureocillium lilacinum TaxID=33203 RepID=A0ABR0BL18_PURLI|nr:hypothetical protein Purlil1_11123 [Purpureocillium lilacinum]